jgi:pimeloyl-ACP methyl ester carboxylesterase
VREPLPQPSAELPLAEPVLLIHGTFANKFEAGKLDWWQPGSTFCSELDAALASQGSAARCLKKRGGERFAPFAWTGENLESARRGGARALAEVIAQLERDPNVRRYHLIAHSHGGNVVSLAMQELEQLPRKLGAVVTLGTPALSFTTGVLNYSWVTWSALVTALALSIWQFLLQSGDAKVYSFAAVVVVALAMFLEGLRQHVSNDSKSFYGSGHAHAFAFAEDEAIYGLINACEIIRDPSRFIQQFLAVEEPSTFAVTPRTPPVGREWRKYQQSGAYLLMTALYNKLNNQATVSSGYSIRTAVGPLASLRKDTQQEMVQKIVDLLQLIPVLPLQWLAVVVAAACALLPLILTAIVDLSVMLVKRIYDRSKRALVALAAGLAWMSLPSLMLKAAFGVDQGSFVSVSQKPPGVTELETLSDELRAETNNLSRLLGSSRGTNVLSGIVSRDPFAIKSQITAALTDSRLVHSHYYQCAEIRRLIAKLIAGQ